MTQWALSVQYIMIGRENSGDVMIIKEKVTKQYFHIVINRDNCSLYVHSEPLKQFHDIQNAVSRDSESCIENPHCY